MIISHSKQFLFIHIPKTAGSSITQTLAEYGSESNHPRVKRMLALLGAPGSHRWNVFRQHATASEAQRHMPRTVYADLFKFAFVRNPWDWLVSMYHFILQRPHHHRHQTVKALRNFDEYVSYEVRRSKTLQKQFVVDRHGNLIVDFVGKFESLTQDFDYVCRAIGLAASLPHVARSSHRDFRDYYNQRTIDLVAMHFRDDIELFGYTFDGSALRAAA